MYEVGTRVASYRTFRVYDPHLTIDMVPGITYQAMFDANTSTTGWEDEMYHRLAAELEAKGCVLTYFGVCHANNRIIIQWTLDNQGAEFQSAILPAIPITVIVLAALGVIGAGIGGVSLFKLSDVCDDSIMGAGVILGGIALAAVLFGVGYVIRGLK